MLRQLSRRVQRYSTQTPGIGFSLNAEQQELQDLARKFTSQEIIPKVFGLTLGR